MTEENFKPRCLSLDLEVGIHNNRIYQVAAVRGDSGSTLAAGNQGLHETLRQLDHIAEGAAFLLGHNIIAFDLPHLQAAMPNLELLKLPAVDTLRLNPLAFPRNPYHHLVKHYQDGQLRRGRINDPEMDARLTLTLFRQQRDALLGLQTSKPDLLLAYHWLTTLEPAAQGFNTFFTYLRRAPRPSAAMAARAIGRLLADSSCAIQADAAIKHAPEQAWALCYTLSWLSVSGGNSVMPPWVRHQFGRTEQLLRLLRDTPCHHRDCSWCRVQHNVDQQLKRWFGFEHFRSEPVDSEGRPLQRTIVQGAMAGEHVLGILPTGTGKSLCYQLPALSRYDKTGALTVVISPLVALMADQVAGMEARGIASCAALNGLLSMPERADVLDRTRLGDLSILIISPEQLRNRACRKVLAQRHIGAWVLDEAHCISKWGHDFRPDYRYVGRFIKQHAGEDTVPPVLCLTATAKPDVIMDIRAHFHDKVGIDLKLFDGGANRSNLDFSVVPTSSAEKLAHVHRLLEQYLPTAQAGGAIVYCASRLHTEEIAAFLRQKGLVAAHFHAKLPPETKKTVQSQFIAGELPVIVATNAFGMGIDKPDVRLVLHADIPGSLENYLQEAGRAGRDRAKARCVLLYTVDDVEKQFKLSAQARLSRREINTILKALRRLERRKHSAGEVVATAGEILAEDEEGAFERDSMSDDTRVRTGLLWLEEASLLSREENRAQVFPSSLQVDSLAAAENKLTSASITDNYRQQLLKIVGNLIDAAADEGLSTDELMGTAGLSAAGVRRALSDLERLGIASNDTALTAFVHRATAHSSKHRFAAAVALEEGLIDAMRQTATDLNVGDSSVLHLRHATQQLKHQGHANALPGHIERLIKSIALDGLGDDIGRGSIGTRRLDAETLQITLLRPWPALAHTARLRRAAAGCLLQHLLTRLPSEQRGNDLLAATTLGDLFEALRSDVDIAAATRDLQKLLDRALLWLHEQDIIRLNKGLAIFRPAMSIQLAPERRHFRKADFEPLQTHYREQILQIHVMAEYARRGLQAMAEALHLSMDYFAIAQDNFVKRWLPGREKELALQTTPQSWQMLVESLANTAQQRIVTDDRERTNVLVLAGPGAGKTRVLVHRIAYLLRVRREHPRGILALTYNRHAAVQIRQRLSALIGDDARGITVLTCHALAMRLVGASFAGGAQAPSKMFSEVLQQAVDLLNGTGHTPEEADAQRERLLAGFRWILVDEYQDIGAEQYDLVSALAGRRLQDKDARLSLFAVGDDDQNIYAFNGASVKYIRCFERDYKAKPIFLTDNYRSTAHIIAAANSVIDCAAERMKADQPIHTDHARHKDPAGGEWEDIDPVARGRVSCLPVGRDRFDQALAVMSELRRLSSLDPNWNWANVAVIAREWRYLEPLRSYCEMHRVPVQMADEEWPQLWRLRETQHLLHWLHERPSALINAASISDHLATKPSGQWQALLLQASTEYTLEVGSAELPVGHFIEWLAEWSRDFRRGQHGLLLLTAHRAKGLEFDHVVVLDGAWDKRSRHEDADAPRRLFYVAMTRARKTLTLGCFKHPHPLLSGLPSPPALLQRSATELPPAGPELARRYVRLTPKDVDIGFAGRFSADHDIHQHIAQLYAGQQLQLSKQGAHWALQDSLGVVIGKLARSFHPPANMHCIKASVAAIIIRRREQSPLAYQRALHIETWEVVLPELVFEFTDY